MWRGVVKGVSPVRTWRDLPHGDGSSDIWGGNLDNGGVGKELGIIFNKETVSTGRIHVCSTFVVPCEDPENQIVVSVSTFVLFVPYQRTSSRSTQTSWNVLSPSLSIPFSKYANSAFEYPSSSRISGDVRKSVNDCISFFYMWLTPTTLLYPWNPRLLDLLVVNWEHLV